MLICNQSDYATQDVARLVRYGFRGIPANGVGVHVVNMDQSRGSCAGAGHAYDGVNRGAIFYGDPRVTRFVHLKMGPPSSYPSDNMVTKYVRQRKIFFTRRFLYDEHGNRRSGTDTLEYVKGTMIGDEIMIRLTRRRDGVVVGTKVRIPYGGKESPFFEYYDWQEGLIALAAHEARHIHQFVLRSRERAKNRRPTSKRYLSESDAERHAKSVLEAFRSDRARVMEAPIQTAARPPLRRHPDIPLYGIARLLSPVEASDDRGPD